MQKKASVHFPGKNKHGKKIKSNPEHNDRTNDKAKNIYKDKSHLNECSMSAKDTRKEIDKLYKQAYQNFYKYCENKNGFARSSGKPKGLQNFTKEEDAFTEAIYEINENTTMEQCQELSKRIADLTGFTPLQIAIHRDEGRYDNDGNFIRHCHAHAVFFTLDKETGLQLNRKGACNNPENLAKMQDIASEVLNMERGERRFEKGEKKLNISDWTVYRAVAQEKQKMEIWKNEALKEIQKEADKNNKSFDTQREILRNKERDLNEREKELERQNISAKAKLQEQFKQIDADYKKSFWLNLLTLGAYNRKAEAKRQKAKEIILKHFNEVEADLSQSHKIASKIHEREKNDLNHTLEQKNAKISEIEQENKQLKEKIEQKDKKDNEIRLHFRKNKDLDALKSFYPKDYKDLTDFQRAKEMQKSQSNSQGFSR